MVILYRPGLTVTLYSDFSFEIEEYDVPSMCLNIMWEKYMFSVLDFVRPLTFICPTAKIGISSKNRKNDFMKLFKLVP